MAAKQLIFDEQARQAILRGVSKLTKAVVATLGPKGRNVVIDKKFGSPTVTKDGVTVAKEIELFDPLAVADGLSQREFCGLQRLAGRLGPLNVLDDLDHERALLFVVQVTHNPAQLAAFGLQPA